MFTDIQEHQINDIVEGTKTYVNYIRNLIESGNWNKMSKEKKLEHSDALTTVSKDIIRLSIMLEVEARTK